MEVWLDLLLHQSLFTPNDEGILVQISGEPLSSLLGSMPQQAQVSGAKRRKLSLEAASLQQNMDTKTPLREIRPSKSSPILRSPNEISFVRRRMFYAKAALSPRGNVSFGLKHIRELLQI